MDIALGLGVKPDAANGRIRNLVRRLPEGEGLLYLAGTHPHLGYVLYAVTTKRVLCINIGQNYALDGEVDVADVVRGLR